ncbi:PadR family transcriptional regulator [Lacticaseibacillus kribbianus]|uniref:PadR family transcriptional regulator n=1 Tax=Lacticaseibacillus kribbianus TaxID=2926292 RepID=UPI001CD3973C|nr:PadR family transcriptional regulator [Lacticaseibacillus kribbianus]
MKQTQLIKGVLEGAVLAIIGDGEKYGYEMIQALRAAGFESIVGGTLYPLLAKLEKNGEVASQLRPSDTGPDRKYYHLTGAGRQSLAAFAQQWEQLVAQVATLLKGSLHDDEK